ncbi:glycosyltransferase family 2 protein [Candidatus Deianiraea vastatrix]|uniref:Glycosyltransferase n=1 Tax=Candidatus Deianiraea vastatrix TaxID=2163644 RepID=A0A5B8XDJ2_9RICK|nr:glycosyltransferase family 2 protein [Candidatus Deianiraea vastatrix]QED23310.1 Putative glycosyltransferase [Candidatus Deianiraea vastatrix]
MKKESLAIVVPFYNENQDGVIDNFFKQAIKTANDITDDWEIICVDDGSRDETYGELLKYAKTDSRIKTIQLARNFGKEIALSCGLCHVTKDYAVPIDCDLQDPLELIPIMLTEIKTGDFDSIVAVRSARDESFVKRFFCKIFYKLMNFFSDRPIIENAGDFRLVNRKMLDTFKQMSETNRYVRGIWGWMGFKVKKIYFKRPDRLSGNPTQSYKKLFTLGFDAIISSSSKPLRLSLVSGFLLSLFAMIFLVFVVIKTLLYGFSETKGLATILSIVLFFNGFILIHIGILSEYVGRIYTETKDRMLYVVKNKENI